MTDIHKKTALQKLAHQLNTSENEINFLEKHSQKELDFLNEKLSEAIIEEQSGIWQPLAKVSKYMPNFLNAKVSEDILGAQITANLTYYMPVKDAVSISNYFSVSFLTDVMEHVNPARVEAVIKASPMHRMKQIVYELIKRKKYFVVAGLIDHTPVNINVEVSKNITPEDLVELSTLINRTDVMAEVMEYYPDKKNKEILIRAIETDKEMAMYEMMEKSNKLKSVLEKLLSELDIAHQEKFKRSTTDNP